MKHLAIALIALITALPAAAQDWTGYYAGISLRSTDWTLNGVDVGDHQDSSVVFGYNRDLGNIVIGAELTWGEISENTPFFAPQSNFSVKTINGRAGVKSGDNLLFYGTAGFFKYNETNSVYHLLGAGVEYRFTDRISVDLLYQNFTSTTNNGREGDALEAQLIFNF